MSDDPTLHASDPYAQYNFIDAVADVWFLAVFAELMKLRGRDLDQYKLIDGVYKELEPILTLLFEDETKNAWVCYLEYYWRDDDGFFNGVTYTLHRENLREIIRKSILNWEIQDELDEIDDPDYHNAKWSYKYTAACA